jgi:DNA-directed RNA polymerase subunit M/transcription elongation factor TFIIS
MSLLAVFAELQKLSVVHPLARRRAVLAFMDFNTMPFDRALALDAAIARTKPTVATYIAEVKRLMFNLASNLDLHAVVPTHLPFLSNEVMARGTIVEVVQRQEQHRHDAFVEMLKERRDAAAPDEAESVIHCRKCSSADLSFVQVQTRAADEPMSCMFSCNKCGYKWRMG